MPRGDRRNWGGRRETTRPSAKRPGRPVVKATIRNGAGLMLTQVYPEGTADLGRGIATIEAIGHSRLIKVPQADGSEIRILIVV